LVISSIPVARKVDSPQKALTIIQIIMVKINIILIMMMGKARVFLIKKLKIMKKI